MSLNEGSQTVSVDCTFKFLMSVAPQPKHGQVRRGNRESLKDELHAVFTARSMKGSIFAADAIATENVNDIVALLSAIPEVCQNTRCLVVDRPLEWDTSKVFAALPCLECVAGAPPCISHLTFHHLTGRVVGLLSFAM